MMKSLSSRSRHGVRAALPSPPVLPIKPMPADEALHPFDDPEARGQDLPEAAAFSREERIRMAAYHRYLQRGEAPGDAYTDWVEAEAALFGTDSRPGE